MNRLQRTAVLVDPHPLWLEAVEPVVARIGVEVVGKSTSARAGLQLVEEHRPDILVTELKGAEGEMDGIALLRRARERVPELRLIVLSMYDDPQHIDAALEAGAIAYVIKTAHPDDIASAIRQGFEHSLFLANGPRPLTAAEPPATDDRVLDLTRRELEILQLMAEGLSNAELARRFWVTEQTVKFHLSNVYRKLDVSNRTEASRWAHVRGLVPAQASVGDAADAA
jgi:DNA-binding NarL/FixJ family response regulator